MGRLIISEIKKVFKSKVNIAILVLFLGATFFFNILSYQRDPFTYNGPIIIDGVHYEGAALNQKLEEEASKFSGTIDSEKGNELFKEYIEKYEKTKVNDSLDEEKMETKFGKAWKQEYFEKVQNNQLSEEDYFEKYCQYGCEYDQDEEGKPIFPIFYKNDGERKLLSILYLNNTDFNHNYTPTIKTMLERNVNSPFYQLSHKEEFLYPSGKYNDSIFFNIDASDKDSVKVANHISEKIKTSSNEYHATLANNIFLENIRSSISVFTLIVIAILMANIFANEAYYKTDQIITPTKVGNTKITIAKCISGILIAAAIVIVQWILTFIAACIFLPIHDLGSVVIQQLGSYTEIVNYAFTYAEVITTGMFITLLCGIATAVVTLGLSYFTRNRFGTIVPMLLVLLVSIFVPVFRILFDMNFLDYLFPSRIITFTELFTAGKSSIVMGNQILSMSIITSGVYIVMMLVILGIMFMHSKKHQVQNR